MAWVLIVEKDAQVRALAEGIIQEAGHQTLCAANPSEARALIRTYELITVLFTDIESEADGVSELALAEEAVRIKPTLKVLYATAHDATDGTKALFVERSGSIAKPYTPSQLLAALAALTEQ